MRQNFGCGLGKCRQDKGSIEVKYNHILVMVMVVTLRNRL